MSGAATTSRDGLELRADDLVDPATMARNLESMRRAEQWMKVRSSTLSSRVHCGVVDSNYRLVQDVVERSRRKSDMLKG
jgi:hypothetical protein